MKFWMLGISDCRRNQKPKSHIEIHGCEVKVAIECPFLRHMQCVRCVCCPGISADKRPLSELFKPSSNKWTCKECYVESDSSLTKCPCCGESAPAAKSAAGPTQAVFGFPAPAVSGFPAPAVSGFTAPAVSGFPAQASVPLTSMIFSRFSTHAQSGNISIRDV